MTNVITVVKYKVKEGFQDQFLDAINSYDYSKTVFWRFVALNENELSLIHI